ncbi:MAG: Sb-PDE family phosphodiesterase [Bacteroidales bacterium]|nr:Sb-PDE family phosphodiesterase [Bacteroidales bacterium]
MKLRLLTLAAMVCAVQASATVPHRAKFPSVGEYQVLLGDCHVHTMFSDGTVWPATRVDEADYDGLDFIAITDHCDTPLQRQLRNGILNPEKVDRNTSYKIASDAAKKYGIIVIHGAELTRGLAIFPGHFNALFIEDGGRICEAAEKAAAEVKEKGGDTVKQEEAAIMAGLQEARSQNAYIQWNHPDWEVQAPNKTVWLPIHTKVYKAGLMDGIEIVNSFIGYDLEAHRWTVEKNLTATAGTDCHKPMFQLVDYENKEYRPMTLVFARERTAEGVKEALMNHRSCVFSDDCIYGPEELTEPLFRAIFEISDVNCTDNRVSFKVRNNSSVPLELAKGEGSENFVYPRLLRINSGEELTLSVSVRDKSLQKNGRFFDLNLVVRNFHTDGETPLKVSYHFEK